MALETRSVALPTGVTLEYAAQGDASGVPVLLLHGLSDSWRSYERVLPHLPESVLAIALTFRGHGDSSKPDAGLAPGDCVPDVAAIMDALQLDDAVIVGHSGGSLVARLFAMNHPERTRALVLIGGFLTLRDNPGVAELQQTLALLSDPIDADFVRAFQGSTLAQPVPADFFETVVRESLKVPVRAWRAVVDGLLQDDSAADLHGIAAPTLIVWGDRDELCSREDQDALAAAIPNARLVVYPGTGHGVHWEEPERFAADLVRFIEDDVR
jgi:non-heme chloroperoxidase